MSASPTATSVRCDDGTEIAFTWVYAGAEEGEWVRDRAHWPDPFPPMEVWLRNRTWAGADRAWQEVGMEAPPTFYRFQFVGPFVYLRMSPYSPERMEPLLARCRDVAAQHGGASLFWQQYAQPRIARVCGELARAGVTGSFQSVAEAWGYGFHQTFTSASLLMQASLRLTALLAEVVGDDATLMALEVTQGGDNASQAIDAEIADVAAIARRAPDVARLLRSTANDDALPALRREPSAAEFIAAFDALIDRHGSRSQGWTLLLPTWREQPAAALSLVRAQLESDAVTPEEMVARSVALRSAATERALARLPAAKHAEFKQIVQELDGYVGVREGRAYWQMTITGRIRALMLRIGSDLVSRGRVASAEDVLFLVPEDLEGGGLASLRDLVAERRSEWERWSRVVMPPIIGTPVSAPVPAAAPHELRGAPASRGVATGPARILRSIEDAERLRKGDILVCVMTTPAWTPLFGIAAGVVTESGGPLSHPAITAREYGIPAILAVQAATSRIEDGQRITIDGGAGIVTLHT